MPVYRDDRDGDSPGLCSGRGCRRVCGLGFRNGDGVAGEEIFLVERGAGELEGETGVLVTKKADGEVAIEIEALAVVHGGA